MMIIAIDVGNTRVKVAVFEKDTMLDKFVFPYIDFQKEVNKIINTYPKVTTIVVASVGKIEKDSFLDFSKKINIHFINKEDKFPFTNLYTTPHSLGIDRLILATGAVLQYPIKNRLVIDAGTCVTYDFIDENDNYLGGAISPGIRLRYEVLHNYTAKLPLLEKEIPENYIGNSTNQSIHSGVVNGLILEMEGFINTYCENYKNFIIILTGGDAEFLAKRFKNTIFANPNFLLESLNQTFQYNHND
jgi:type III pantothenate kinase